MADHLTTREAIRTAAANILSSRSRQGACDFLNSHRDGPCQRCQDRDRHDAEVAAQAAPALTSREQRAVEILNAGLVAYVAGDAYVTVTGSAGESYRASRDGCQCADWTNRGSLTGERCKHMLAGATICGLYRECRAVAARGETVRLPLALYVALTNGTARKGERSRALAELAAADQSDLFAPNPADCRICAYPLVDGRGAQGLCPKCYSATRAPAVA
jgi:hypothetical protein